MLERQQQGNEEDEQRTEDGLSFIASFTVLLLSRYGDHTRFQSVLELLHVVPCRTDSSVLSIAAGWDEQKSGCVVMAAEANMSQHVSALLRVK